MDLCYEEEFDALCAAYPNFSWHVALSGSVALARSKYKVGFIHDIAYDNYLRNHPNPEQADYLVCGPPVMMAAVTTMLEDLGVEQVSIYYDDFGGQT